VFGFPRQGMVTVKVGGARASLIAKRVECDCDNGDVPYQELIDDGMCPQFGPSSAQLTFGSSLSRSSPELRLAAAALKLKRGARVGSRPPLMPSRFASTPFESSP
jgi:hypothetical protein